MYMYAVKLFLTKTTLKNNNIYITQVRLLHSIVIVIEIVTNISSSYN